MNFPQFIAADLPQTIAAIALALFAAAVTVLMAVLSWFLTDLRSRFDKLEGRIDATTQDAVEKRHDFRREVTSQLSEYYLRIERQIAELRTDIKR
jgi:hypothetical protein